MIELGGQTIEDEIDSKHLMPRKDINTVNNEYDSNYTHSVFLNGNTPYLIIKSLHKILPSVTHSIEINL